MIVTISRQMGSGGDELAVEVAARLGLQLVDRDVVHAAALAAGVPADLLKRLLYEGHRSLATEVMDSLGTPPPPGTASQAGVSPLLGVFAPMLPLAAVTLEDAARAVGQVIQGLASLDNVLVVGQGGQRWLVGRPGACHIQVVAPLDDRVRWVAQSSKISLTAARRQVRACDQARADYLARFHGVSWLDPLLYHLVINTGQVTADIAAALIVQAARAIAEQR